MMAQATQSGHGQSKPSTTQGTDLDQCLKYMLSFFDKSQSCVLVHWSVFSGLKLRKNECNSNAKYHCENFVINTKRVDVENC
ncbi:hypothetical protein T11_2890 [Trichinella zimbabwensis]|uniref:Uncharacterized protein n=1 Tax=Trichinella zimbabwensis TaxID=268475 RepID=A0A0V1HTV5_9BILA|nr:hypothetical protein T11_2890 [Trichinella zimbabwensis]